MTSDVVCICSCAKLCFRTGFWCLFASQRMLVLWLRRRWLSCLVAGDMFGEVGLVFRIPRVATVVSTSFVDVYTMSRQNYEQVVQKNVDMVRSIVQLARSRLSESSKRKVPPGRRPSIPPSNLSIPFSIPIRGTPFLSPHAGSSLSTLQGSGLW